MIEGCTFLYICDELNQLRRTFSSKGTNTCEYLLRIQSYQCITYKRLIKASSYIAQYPVLRTIQSALHFTSLTYLFTQTPSRLLWEASSHMLQLMREGCSYTYPPLSIVRYSFIQLSELEQCRVKKLAQGFNTAARIRTRVLALPLSHSALLIDMSSNHNCSSVISNSNAHIFTHAYTSQHSTMSCLNDLFILMESFE